MHEGSVSIIFVGMIHTNADPEDVIVIGSGPAAFGATIGLLENGHSVLVIGPGLELEPEKQEIANRLSQKPLGAWTEEDLRSARGPIKVSRHGFGTKLVFGSDFATREAHGALPISSENEPRPHISHAFGGLSRIWGSGSLSPLWRDIDDWGIGNRQQWSDAFLKASQEMGTCGTHDDLDQDRPPTSIQHPPLELCSGAQHLLSNYTKHTDKIRHLGWRMGRARLALKTLQCRYCGLCLTGCPDRLIWDSAQSFEKLLNRFPTQLRIELHFLVISIRETENEICEITALDTKSQKHKTLKTRRAFVAAGAITSTRILMESRNHYNQSVGILDSQYYILPLWIMGRRRSEKLPAAPTVGHLALEYIRDRTDFYGIHPAGYEVQKALESTLSFLGNRVAAYLSQFIASRIMIMSAFLPSDDSGKMLLEITKHETKSLFSIRYQHSNKISSVLKLIKKNLWKVGYWLRAIPLTPALAVKAYGQGYHFGGSIPMKQKPAHEWESDSLGRPGGRGNIHFVDGAILPSIPAGNTTVLIVANAIRISQQIAKEPSV